MFETKHPYAWSSPLSTFSLPGSSSRGTTKGIQFTKSFFLVWLWGLGFSSWGLSENYLLKKKKKKSSLQLSSESAGEGNDCFHGVNSTIMQMGILGKHCLFWSSALCVQIVELLAKASRGKKKCELVQNSTSKWTYIWRHYFEKFKLLSFQRTFQNQNFHLN